MMLFNDRVFWEAIWLDKTAWKSLEIHLRFHFYYLGLLEWVSLQAGNYLSQLLSGGPTELLALEIKHFVLLRTLPIHPANLWATNRKEHHPLHGASLQVHLAVSWCDPSTVTCLQAGHSSYLSQTGVILNDLLYTVKTPLALENAS